MDEQVERGAFEVAELQRWNITGQIDIFSRPDGGEYQLPNIEQRWQGWEMRAAQLAAPDLRATFRDTMDSLDMAELAVQQELRIAELEKQLSAPASYKLVPIEPTQAMMDAAEKTVPQVFSMGDEYRAMVAAAPQGEG